VAVLRQVPQQPIFGGMVEDEAISYTFEQYFKTQDPTWPLLLPMVKSAVRGMDAVQQFAAESWQLKIERFTLTGASKRGWTTWLTASVDPRVSALAPMVIDMLNLIPQMKHQVDSFGKFSEQIDDYTTKGLPLLMATPTGQKLLGMVDPFSYRKALTQPKLILLGTNDRYWPLDALNLYWPELEGQKHVLYVPNNGHGLRDYERVLGSIVALHRQATGELKLARPTWEVRAEDGRLELELASDVRPRQVLAWTAEAPSRDFREAKWTSQALTESEGRYRFDQPLPPQGFAALFGEAKYDGGTAPYFLSTTVRIAPAGK
jgi:PhoPQ-activated pathogenicity-related protein